MPKGSTLITDVACYPIWRIEKPGDGRVWDLLGFGGVKGFHRDKSPFPEKEPRW